MNINVKYSQQLNADGGASGRERILNPAGVLFVLSQRAAFICSLKLSRVFNKEEKFTVNDHKLGPRSGDPPETYGRV